MAKTPEILRLLSAALFDSGLEEEAKTVESLCESSLQETMDRLSRLEIEVNDAQVHRAIAQCKQTLTGKREPDEFINQFRQMQGLI